MKNKSTNGKEIIEYLNSMPLNDLRCPECWRMLKESDEKDYFCPNEMCLNEEHYDKEGYEVDKE